LPDPTTTSALVALGANLPYGGHPPAETLNSALDALDRLGLRTTRRSRLFATPCFPKGAGPDYVNAAAELRIPTDMQAHDLLSMLLSVEQQMGRERTRRWGMRTLDLDLLAIGDAVLPDATTFWKWHDLDPSLQSLSSPDRLVLPHPRLQDRAFVLVPLNDVAPDWRHPLLDHSVTEMLDKLPPADRAEVVPL
jgi:2-amino-4-hydroxy-6-hydroxymethyldihydropteridine diphosphokinase